MDNNTLKTFNKIYNDTYNDVSKYVVCNVSRIDDIDDIIQNIYIDVFKCIKNNKKITKKYLMGICSHKLKDYYRFKYKLKLEMLFSKNKENFEEIIPDSFDLEKTIINKYDTEKVWAYLKSKKIIIFKIFYLYYILDIPIKKISEYLNISLSNTKHYLYRTLKELASFIESDGDNNE